MIYNDFISFGKTKGYYLLENKSIVRKNADTYFIGSAAMAHMELFNILEDSSTTQVKKYITGQPAFISKRLNDVGKYPLESSLQVMLSIFHFNDEGMDTSIKFVLDFLNKYLRFSYQDLLYLAPKEAGIVDTLSELGIPSDQIITWQKGLQLTLGEGRPKGHYLKIFVPYKNGVIPVATLGFIMVGDKITIDSALYVERLQFIAEQKDHIFESSLFEPLNKAIVNHAMLSDLSEKYKHIWVHHIRSLVALLNEGVSYNGKGSGHIVRRMVRQLGTSICGQSITFEEIQNLVQAAFNCLQKIDVMQKLTTEQVSLILFGLINNASNQLNKEREKFSKWLERTKEINNNELRKWHDERGIPIEIIDQMLLEKGHTPITKPEHSNSFRLQQACYAFNKDIVISNTVQFLIEAEHK